MKRLALVLSLVCFSSPAFAQSAEDKATAQSLFDRGLKLLETKSYDEACPLLAESQRLDPAQGTLFRLATCLEGQGKIAGAWAAYIEVAEDAKAGKKADREKLARHLHVARADDLDQRRGRAHGYLRARADAASAGERGAAVPRGRDPGAHAAAADAGRADAARRAVSGRSERQPGWVASETSTSLEKGTET